jgi:hypothetical protein
VLSRPGRAAFWVGGLDVGHGGLGADAEHVHEVDRVGGVGGLVEDAVAAQLRGGEPEPLEDGVHDSVGDRRECRIGGGDLADEQVRVAGSAPQPSTFVQPRAGQGVGEFIEVDGVVAGVSPNEQPTGGQVEIVQQQLRGFLLAEAVDGDQGDDELGHRPVGPVDEAAQPVGGYRRGEAANLSRRNPASRSAGRSGTALGATVLVLVVVIRRSRHG